MEPATVVIDNGTGFTKMGYAGNMEPSYLIPTTIATKVQNVRIAFIALTVFIITVNWCCHGQECIV